MQVCPGLSHSEHFNTFIIIPDRSVDEARETYERLVEIFPTCGRYWKLYIEQEVTTISDISFIEGNIKLTLELVFMKSEYIPLIQYIVVSFVLFPLQIRAGKFENVEKVNKLVKLTARPTYFI